MWKWISKLRPIGTNYICNDREHPYSFMGNLENVLGLKKISTNLKYHLLDHMAGKAAKDYWAGKTCFWDVNINLVDWAIIKKVVQSQTINMHRWTTKFITGFCATGCQMVKTKLWPTVACPCCGHPNKDTGHILQCPHLDVQLLWDTAILQLHEYLHDNKTKPSLFEDLSARINAWRRKELQPLAITPAGQAQANLTWQNLVHSFLSTD